MSHNAAQHRIGCLNHEPHVPGEACGYMRIDEIRGLGVAQGGCVDGFCDKAARESARMGKAIGERLSAFDQEKVPAGTPVLGLDALTSAYGVGQQARAPGKMFSRSDILAVIRAHRGVAGNVADAEYQKLIAAFEAME